MKNQENEQVKCKRCESDLFVIYRKGQHLMARCSACDTFYQSIPQYKPATAEDTMPFGKHKGMKFTELPLSYIGWGCENMTNENIKTKLQHELARRMG